jgi:hypothetical protein
MRTDRASSRTARSPRRRARRSGSAPSPRPLCFAAASAVVSGPASAGPVERVCAAADGLRERAAVNIATVYTCVAHDSSRRLCLQTEFHVGYGTPAIPIGVCRGRLRIADIPHPTELRRAIASPLSTRATCPPCLGGRREARLAPASDSEARTDPRQSPAPTSVRGLAPMSAAVRHPAISWRAHCTYLRGGK